MARRSSRLSDISGRGGREGGGGKLDDWLKGLERRVVAGIAVGAVSQLVTVSVAGRCGLWAVKI
jgi:hypothetical protein